jgi:hypothetical protein
VKFVVVVCHRNKKWYHLINFAQNPWFMLLTRIHGIVHAAVYIKILRWKFDWMMEWRVSNTLLEKIPSIRTFSPHTIRSAANGRISPGSIENVDQGLLVPVQLCPFVLVCATNRD